MVFNPLLQLLVGDLVFFSGLVVESYFTRKKRDRSFTSPICSGSVSPVATPPPSASLQPPPSLHRPMPPRRCAETSPTPPEAAAAASAGGRSDSRNLGREFGREVREAAVPGALSALPRGESQWLGQSQSMQSLKDRQG